MGKLMMAERQTALGSGGVMGRCAEASGLSSFSLEEVHRVAPRAPGQVSCRLPVANAVKVFIDLGMGTWICVFSGSPKGSTPVCATRFPCAISLCGVSARFCGQMVVAFL